MARLRWFCWLYCWKRASRSEEHTSELQSRFDLVCRLLLEKKKNPCTLRHPVPRRTPDPPLQLDARAADSDRDVRCGGAVREPEHDCGSRPQPRAMHVLRLA